MKAPRSAGEPRLAMRLGTRSSKLALYQTELIADRLRAVIPGLVCTIVTISTHGDEDRDRPLPEIGGKGLFTEKIEEALRDNRIDAAVHSLKDLPVDDSPGLILGAVLGREEVRDVVVSRDGMGLFELPAGAVVGTSSTRREAQLRALRPDLAVKPIRGNVETRIAKVARGEYDATVMAGAGLMRLGLAGRVSHWMDAEQFLPAPGQGALAVQCRADDEDVLRLLALVDDPALRKVTDAEREFLGRLGGGCAAPVAAHATVSQGPVGVISLHGRVISMDGREVVDVKGQGDDPRALAARLVEEAAARGAGAILRRERRPLKGKRVLVTRSREQASELVSLLSERGAVPVMLPLIRIEPAGNPSQIASTVERLSSYDWVVFTSVNGVEHFFRHVRGRPLMHRVAAVGSATAAALEAAGVRPSFIPSGHTGAALAKGLLEQELREREAAEHEAAEHEPAALSRLRILFPCALEHDEEAARILRAAGAAVVELTVYRTVAEEPGSEELASLAGGVQAALFLSGSAARAAGGLAHELSKAVVGCIGPTTAAAAREAGIHVDVVPTEHTSEALVDALEERFSS